MRSVSQPNLANELLDLHSPMRADRNHHIRPAIDQGRESEFRTFGDISLSGNPAGSWTAGKDERALGVDVARATVGLCGQRIAAVGLVRLAEQRETMWLILSKDRNKDGVGRRSELPDRARLCQKGVDARDLG